MHGRTAYDAPEQEHVVPSAESSSEEPDKHVSMFHVCPPHERLLTMVPVCSAWHNVFASAPEHVRPMVSFEPLSVIDVYVPVRLARNASQSVHCVVGTMKVSNDA